MSEYRCWEEDQGIEDADVIQATSAENAAEEFAELAYDNSAGECGVEFKVMVLDPSGNVSQFTITVDFYPDFTAHSKAHIRHYVLDENDNPILDDQ
jgi:hypothetical protein